MKSAKPIFLTAAVAVLLILVAVILLQKDPSIQYSTFDPHFVLVLHQANFQTLRESTRPSEEVALPLRIKCIPHYWFRKSPTLAIGFPDSVMRYGLVRGDAGPVECLVRYLDGRATCIDIRYPNGQEALASTLRDTLGQEFPGLPISVIAPVK